MEEGLAVQDNEESWKVIPGFPMYSVSDQGRVMRNVRGKSTWPGKILAPNRIKKGYVQVGLRQNGQRTIILIHRLVLMAFVSPQPEGYEANHKDGNTSHNVLSNLEWVTPKDNVAHAFQNSLRHQMSGQRSVHTKLADSEVWLVKKLLYHGISQTIIGKMFRVTKQCIWRIKAGLAWADINYYPKEVSL